MHTYRNDVKTLNIITIMLPMIAAIFFCDVAIDVAQTPIAEFSRTFHIPRESTNDFQLVFFVLLAVICFLLSALNLWIYLKKESLQNDNPY